DSLEPRIHEEADVYAPVQVPFLGKLPLLSGAPCLTEDPDPMVAESIRMVRTALLRRLGASGGKVVLITSSVSRAGKTSVAVLLTRSLAKLGKKTLLVEADLRRPSIADRMGFVADFGLAAVLTGTIEAEEVIVSTPIANLDVLPAGSRPSNFDFELLANGAFGSCLKRWRESYDFIVLDSPPVFPVADARILATQVDGTIMVLRSAHCRRTDVFQAYTDLIAGGGKVVGTVFIGANSEAVYGDYAEGRQYLETV
ncbi:MAG: CpsD/CapB family tyrosine-protein kinase, partial [Planctomycetes bacterium]|nr:CpsD/CapB family tyrosine-protein kinase [Planctomycetota bacterium]